MKAKTIELNITERPAGAATTPWASVGRPDTAGMTREHLKMPYAARGVAANPARVAVI